MPVITPPRTSTPTLIAAMRALSIDIESPDGTSNAVILDASERLEELHNLLIAVDGMGRQLPDKFHDEIMSAIE